MTRAIYEDDVIKLLDKGWKTGVYPVASNIHALPTAQPESIKCKDCGYAEERGCALFCGFWTRYTAHKGYCFKAERREDG